MTPAETRDFFEGQRERHEDLWELAAWIVMHLVNGVGRKLRGPVNMTTLIPALHAARTARREAARKAAQG